VVADAPVTEASCFLVRVLAPETLACLSPGAAFGTFRCHPPLPTPLPPGFVVELEGGESKFRVQLWPVLPEADQLLAITDAGIATLCGPWLENLVNLVAHDLRNLFFTIALQAEMAARHGGEVKPSIETILTQLARVQQYLERLLLYGRKPNLALATLNVETFVREKLRSLRANWPADQPPLSLRLVVEGEAGVARWDPYLLGQALEAVLDNAARATGPGQEVEVTVRGEKDRVVLEVQDHGSGIPPELLPRVFLPMAVRRPHGLGLGLPIARKLVKAHGGSLTLTSSPQGTKVRFLLPREAQLG